MAQRRAPRWSFFGGDSAAVGVVLERRCHPWRQKQRLSGEERETEKEGRRVARFCIRGRTQLKLNGQNS